MTLQPGRLLFRRWPGRPGIHISGSSAVGGLREQRQDLVDRLEIRCLLAPERRSQ